MKPVNRLMIEAATLVRAQATPEARRAAARELLQISVADLVEWPEWRSYGNFALHQASLAAAGAPDSVRRHFVEAIQSLLRAARAVEEIVPPRQMHGDVRQYWLDRDQ